MQSWWQQRNLFANKGLAVDCRTHGKLASTSDAASVHNEDASQAEPLPLPSAVPAMPRQHVMQSTSAVADQTRQPALAHPPDGHHLRDALTAAAGAVAKPGEPCPGARIFLPRPITTSTTASAPTCPSPSSFSSSPPSSRPPVPPALAPAGPQPHHQTHPASLAAAHNPAALALSAQRRTRTSSPAPPPGGRQPAPAALYASFYAGRAALNAKLARHPMPCLTHYHTAMELTRRVEKLVSYPAPYARGRSAYKMPGAAEPEDAPECWRDQVVQAVAAAAVGGATATVYGAAGGLDGDGVGGMGVGGLRLDAAYLRRGCIVLVLEYSSPLPGGRELRAPRAPSGTGDGVGPGCGVGVARAPPSRRPAAASRLPLPPALTREQLAAAFGSEVLPASGAGPAAAVEVVVQHFTGPTGGGGGGSGRGGGVGPYGLEERGDDNDDGAGGEHPAAMATALSLAGRPCVLICSEPLRVTVAITRPDSRDGTRASAGTGGGASNIGGADGGGSGGSGTGDPTPTAPPLPRILARYGGPESKPHPCSILPYDAAGDEDELPYDEDDLGRGTMDVVRRRVPAPASDTNTAMEGAGSGAGAGASQCTAAPCTADGNGSSCSGGAANGGGGGGSSSDLAVSIRVRAMVGPCPQPGLLLLELQAGEAEAEAEVAGRGAVRAGGPASVQVRSRTTASSSSSCPRGRPALLAPPVPVVVVDDPAVQREVNALTMAAAPPPPASAAGGAAAAAAAAAAPPSAPSEPDWLLAFLFDLGRFLELAAAVCARVEAQHSAAAAALRTGVDRRMRASAAAAAVTGACHQTGRYPYDGGDGGGCDDNSCGGWSSDDGGYADGGPLQSAAAALEGDDAHLLRLAAALASYTCRQRMPATLSYIISRSQHAGVTLLQLDEAARVLDADGLSLAHHAVRYGNLEALKTLVLAARPLQTHSASSSLRPRPDAASGGGRSCSGARLAAMNDCTALFVVAGPGGVTPLHLLATQRHHHHHHKQAGGRSADLAQVLFSLCPLAAHAWFEARDDAGNSAAQYALQAGNWELNEQCQEQLAMEALEAEELGGGEGGGGWAGDVPAAALAEAEQLARAGAGRPGLQGRGQEPDAGPAALLVNPWRGQGRGHVPDPGPSAAAVATGTPHHGYRTLTAVGSAPARAAAAAATAAAATAPAGTADSNLNGDAAAASMPTALVAAAAVTQEQPHAGEAAAAAAAAKRKAAAPPRRPASPSGVASAFGANVAALGAAARSLRQRLRGLPWLAPLRGFPEPSLEAAFAARTSDLALQRNRFTLAFYVIFLAGCIQKALVTAAAAAAAAGAGGAPAAAAAGAALGMSAAVGLPKLAAVAAVGALRLRGAAHDAAQAGGDLACGEWWWRGRNWRGCRTRRCSRWRTWACRNP